MKKKEVRKCIHRIKEGETYWECYGIFKKLDHEKRLKNVKKIT